MRQPLSVKIQMVAFNLRRAGRRVWFRLCECLRRAWCRLTGRTFMPRGMRIEVPLFEITSNPTVKLGDIKKRRFSLVRPRGYLEGLTREEWNGV